MLRSLLSAPACTARNLSQPATCPPVPNPHPLHCHSPPLPLLSSPPQLDFFKYADFDLAPPEIQADLYEAAPEAWKRNA